MLTHPTLDQLKALNLDGMAEVFVELQNQAQAADLSHAEWLGLLLDREMAHRNSKRFKGRLRSAKLRHSQAAIAISNAIPLLEWNEQALERFVQHVSSL